MPSDGTVITFIDAKWTVEPDAIPKWILEGKKLLTVVNLKKKRAN